MRLVDTANDGEQALPVEAPSSPGIDAWRMEMQMKSKVSRRVTRSVLDLVGNTPLVELSHEWSGNSARLLAKLEGANPTGSLKDRIAKFMIEEAERQGRLEKHHIIVEGSSGNTGISLGMVAKLKGYRCRIFMPESKSKERRVLIRSWGAELVLTDGKDPYSHINSAARLGREFPDEYFFIDQNGNKDNSRAHYLTTGGEILQQMGDEEIHGFVAGFGTGGTVMGVGRRIKERWPNAKIYQVEPKRPISKIEGLLHHEPDKFTPGILEPGITDETLHVEDEDAVAAAHLLGARDGLFCGISAGAVIHAASVLARDFPGKNFVVLFGDRGERYLSTALCDKFRDA